MKKILFSCFIFFILLVSCSHNVEIPTLYEARVLSVTDGDTISVRFNDTIPTGCNKIETVRLIGINTPELFKNPVEYFAPEAKDFTNTILYQEDIYIELDKNLRDIYGRLLAFVRLPNNTAFKNKFSSYCKIDGITSVLHNNTFLFNEAIILSGYAYNYDNFTFNSSYMSRFSSAEEYAEINDLGLWK